MNTLSLNHQQCYEAVASRDRRFDGLFFFCVKTTGIYCRVGCPAPRPKLGNVEFSNTAAAAADAGFRPCRRCRPELAPGVDWSGQSQLLGRALRAIDDAVIEGFNLERCALQLGVSSRHLRRLFVQTLGATPSKIIQTRRLHLAKQLLDETTLTSSDIAFAAGYQSLRRFNDEIKQRWQCSPSELRKKPLSPTPQDQLSVRLSYRQPFNWPHLLAFLAARSIAGVEAVNGEYYYRAVAIGGAIGRIKVSNDDARAQLNLTVDASLIPVLAATVARVRRLFDLDATPAFAEQQLSHDVRLASAISSAPGLRVAGAWDGFECAVRAILGQQISVKAATTLSDRVVTRLGDRVMHDSEQAAYIFPGPATLVSADMDGLRITGRRVASIKALANACLCGDINFDQPPPSVELERQMTALPGIGPWTAQYVAMRVGRDPDAFPAGDLVLQKSVTIGERLMEKQLLSRAESWRPWRAYAAIYLWQSYHTGGGG
ncbi:MAG: AlkA N-terminal domain-containing protein [Spongiibacteraceae bacterium]